MDMVRRQVAFVVYVSLAFLVVQLVCIFPAETGAAPITPRLEEGEFSAHLDLLTRDRNSQEKLRETWQAVPLKPVQRDGGAGRSWAHLGRAHSDPDARMCLVASPPGVERSPPIYSR